MADITYPPEMLPVSATSEKPRVIICQGPPRCDNDLVRSLWEMPCPWCRIEEVEADGSITVIQEPASA